jgi:hypothetical protein
VLYSRNKPDDFILAMVEFMTDGSHRVHYLRRPVQREPEFGVVSQNHDLRSCWRGLESQGDQTLSGSFLPFRGTKWCYIVL